MKSNRFKPYWHSIGWVVIVLAWLVWEWIGLRSRKDGKRPFTYYVRSIAGNWKNPMWWVLGGFLLWLIAHFLVEQKKKKVA